MIRYVCAAGALALSVCSAFAQEATDEKVAELERRIHDQARQIAELDRRLAGAEQETIDQARTEAMRQQIREILSDAEFRESLMPSTMLAGYDNGFYIKSSDDQFALKVNGRMQFRWTHYGTQSRNHYRNPRLERNDRTGFDIQRLRLNFSGHAYSRDLTYRIEMQADSSGSYDALLRYASANYRFIDEFQFMAGIFKIAATRSQMTSVGGLQFVDRPMPDAVFSLDRGLGVRFWGRLFDKRLDYYLDIVNSFNATQNRTITPDPAEHDNIPGIVFHTVWHAIGDNPGKDFANEGDDPRHDSPALDLGFHYAFNEDQGDLRTTRVPFPSTRRSGIRGGFGLTNTNGMQIHQFGWEAAFKLAGFSATGEYYFRILDPRRAGRLPITPWTQLTGQGDTTVMHGAYVQVGYFLPIPGLEDKLEAVARVGGISTAANGREGSWEYAGGLNYYIEGNRVKLQTDVTRIYEAPISSATNSLANVNDEALIWRVQLQVSF